jgi:hypothetical protein
MVSNRRNTIGHAKASKKNEAGAYLVFAKIVTPAWLIGSLACLKSMRDAGLRSFQGK